MGLCTTTQHSMGAHSSHCRLATLQHLVLNTRSSKAAEPAELEKIDMWQDVDENFETVSQQAWNSVIAQVWFGVACDCMHMSVRTEWESIRRSDNRYETASLHRRNKRLLALLAECVPVLVGACCSPLVRMLSHVSMPQVKDNAS
eukprot:scaffold82678_cov23-Tisochrysis_lutea.AAC.1